MAWTTASERVLPFEVDVFGRLRGPEGVCHKGDHEFRLVFTVYSTDEDGTRALLDMSGAGSYTLVMIDPDNTQRRYTMTNRDHANGEIEYEFAAGELDEAGAWLAYAEVAFSTAVVTTNRATLYVQDAQYRAPEKKNNDRFGIVSHDASATAADKIFYLRNDRQGEDFVVDQIIVGAVQTALWKVWVVTGTASGTGLSPTNLDTGSIVSSGLSSNGNGAVTGLTENGQLLAVRTGANETQDITTQIIVAPGKAIAVEYDTGTTGIAEVSVSGYFR